MSATEELTQEDFGCWTTQPLFSTKAHTSSDSRPTTQPNEGQPKSYFKPSSNKSAIKNKSTDIQDKVSIILDAKRSVAERQISLMEAKEKRDIVLHSLLVEEKKLDIEIKRAKLAALQKRVENDD